MNLVPDPLHPAVVHFPIVLILLGAAAAVAAALWRRRALPYLAAGFLLLGAAGAWAAVETGESDGALLDTEAGAAEALLDEHQAWAERTLMAAAVAAAMAIASAATLRWNRLSRILGIATAVTGLTAGWMVFETGHRGGALVYRHGAGVMLAPPGGAAGTDRTLKPPTRPRPERDDD